MDGGTLKELSPGHYEATVTTIGTANVTVSGEVSKGKTQDISTTPYRVKRIPDPKAQFGGKSGGNTSAANIKAQDRIFAKLDNFEYDAKFNVTHFTLIIKNARQDAIIKQGTGNILTPDMHAAMNSVAPGSFVIFNNIIAVGPDGTQREIDPIVLSAN